MKTTSSRIVVAILFAVAIIASSAVMKGAPLSGLVTTALTGIGLTFAVLRRPACGR